MISRSENLTFTVSFYNTVNHKNNPVKKKERLLLRRENQGDLFDDQVVLPSLESVLTGISSCQRCDDRTTYFSAPDVDLSLYDHIIVCLSGGKDSIAAYLRLVDMGVD